MYEMFRYLSITVADRVATVVMSRPERLNACDKSGHGELSRVLRVLGRDPDVYTVVITGEGKAFSVGGDLQMIADLNSHPEDLPATLAEAREIVQSIIDFEKPIVSAINGVAMGVGASFGLMCDIIIAERSALIADGHIRAALSAGDGGVLAWPMSMGIVKAKQYLMTGDFISAGDAERFGLVTEVVEDGESLARATVVARQLAAKPQFAIRATKASLNQWYRLGQVSAFDYSLALEMLTVTHPDVPDALERLQKRDRGPAETP
jgi:enoyl-CoA hydratase